MVIIRFYFTYSIQPTSVSYRTGAGIILKADSVVAGAPILARIVVTHTGRIQNLTQSSRVSYKDF